MGEVKKQKFWNREKYWKENYEGKVLEEIVNPINSKIAGLRAS